ncbi:hypothetical protein K437DRAFT_65961 [Tilletiaria anomala UBC 951]|uniref:Uncharacterized protein n=1 Tax=Tilletiaria anomala (strain ATCC 24038 / CBS 436.72 / UBC 951) TaxID=1037660 RepID=A0A066W8W9_TILAU|nr:uncharacterized protein K437DRAFT_65961 [Tilletiaria anomala UBC 951]KDN50387.1 hypothetical protein K437DRAFT_65961 [Tilletiaria anomala UBC 951]
MQPFAHNLIVGPHHQEYAPALVSQCWNPRCLRKRRARQFFLHLSPVDHQVMQALLIAMENTYTRTCIECLLPKWWWIADHRSDDEGKVSPHRQNFVSSARRLTHLFSKPLASPGVWRGEERRGYRYRWTSMSSIAWTSSLDHAAETLEPAVEG